MMPAMRLLLANDDFMYASNFTSGLKQFMDERSLALTLLPSIWSSILAWLLQPSTRFVVLEGDLQLT